LEQHLAGPPLYPGSLTEKPAELLFSDPVDALDLLLLAQLKTVFRILAALLPVLARSITPAFETALVGFASGAFEEELHSLAAA
jgi:hypothetical protein